MFPPDRTRPLTPRQAEIAGLVARGLTAVAIAKQTGISPDTVRVHITQAAERVPGAGSPRHRLLVWAFSQGRPGAP